MTAARTSRAATPATTRTAAPDLRVERALLRRGHGRLVALDEVGRGALAGPVTVGAVVVTASTGRVPRGLRDSKLLTADARRRLVGPIRRWASDWAVGHAGADEIDALGLMTALAWAARRALAQLTAPADVALLDGNVDYLSRFGDTGLVAPPPGPMYDGVPGPGPVPVGDTVIPVQARIKADRDCAAVAAASVLAKTTRDALMEAHGIDYPAYRWAENKGYGTAAHRAALARYGACPLHRRSWHLLDGTPQWDAADAGG